jgi:hypothetical protein
MTLTISRGTYQAHEKIGITTAGLLPFIYKDLTQNISP